MKIKELFKVKTGYKIMIRPAMILITFTVLFVFAVFNLDQCFAVLLRVYQILFPFLCGIVFAFILNVFVKVFEERVFSRIDEKKHKVWHKCRRPVCVLITYAVVFGIIAFVVIMLVPELAHSMSSLQEIANNVPEYWDRFVLWVNGILQDYEFLPSELSSFDLDWGNLVERIINLIGGGGETLVSMTVGLTSAVVNIVMALIFSVYLLLDKEKLLRNVKQVLFAFLPKRQAVSIVRVGTTADRIFSGYVTGQCTEALILGTLCYIGMIIMQTPFPLLVSTIIAVTSFIPMFGAYIGGFIGGVIIFVIDPLAFVWFLIFLILLQNFEGNFIYPKVVGSSVGLPALWVIVAIFVFGSLFGFVGMLIGVPTFSLLYTLFREATHDKLRKKKITDADIERASLSSILAGDVPISEEQVENKEEIDVKEESK